MGIISIIRSADQEGKLNFIYSYKRMGAGTVDSR